MMRRFCTFAFLAAVSAISVAAGPQSWRAATQPEFLKGDLEQVSVDETGRLTLGPAITRVFDAGVPFVLTAVAGSKRATGPQHKLTKAGVILAEAGTQVSVGAG